MSDTKSGDKFNFDDFEKDVRNIFINERDGQKQILDVSVRIPENRRHDYPEIAFHAAKVYLNKGQHAQARQQLQICTGAWMDNQENLARSYLLHAYLCKLERDLPGLQEFAEKVQKTSTKDNLLAECQILLGEAIIDSEPSKALLYFDDARQRYIRSSVHNPLATADAVRASLFAASTAFRQGKAVIARQYQRYAREAAQQYGNRDLLSAVLMQTADAHVFEGNYEESQIVHQEAMQYVGDNQQKMVALDYRRARLAYLMNDDRQAENILSKTIHTDHSYTLCQWILCQGWLAALQYRVQDAHHKLEEVRAIMRGDERIVNQARLLQGLIAAQSGYATDETLQVTLAARDYFVKNIMIIEASQTKFILAWLYALRGDEAHVLVLIDDLEVDIQRLQHVQHLARLYQMSITLLGGWWGEALSSQMEETLASRKFSEGIRVYALGVPRIFVQGGELKQRERYGRISVQLLIYMLEKRQAQLHEIIVALWEDANPDNAPQRFHTLMSTTKKQPGFSDWCTYSKDTQLYVVKNDFPHYYDADDFRNTFDLLQSSQTPVQRLTHCMKLLNMYKSFASTFDSEAFVDLRHQYEARIYRALTTVGDLLPAVADDIPRQRYEELCLQIDSYALP